MPASQTAEKSTVTSTPDDSKLTERFSISVTPLMKRLLEESAAKRQSGLGLSAECFARLRKSLKLAALDRKLSATKNRKPVAAPAKVVGKKRAN